MQGCRFLSQSRETVQLTTNRELFWRHAVEAYVRMRWTAVQMLLRPISYFRWIFFLLSLVINHVITDRLFMKRGGKRTSAFCKWAITRFFFSLQICFLAVPYDHCFLQLNLCFILFDFVSASCAILSYLSLGVWPGFHFLYISFLCFRSLKIVLLSQVDLWPYFLSSYCVGLFVFVP